MTEITDEVLLENLKRGEVDSLALIYERYKILLYNYFLRTTRDYDASNDLLMATFERIHKYRRSYEPTKKARPWIYQIASNLAKDHFRKSKSNKGAVKMKAEIPASSDEPLNDTEDRNSRLMLALSKLNPTERNIITMYYLLEMSYEDIAFSQKITINNTRIKVYRALKKLRELLKDSGI